jgi:7-cyano-7-deazaguanine synthase
MKRSSLKLQKWGVYSMRKKAVVLYSGGLDSTTCLAMAVESGFTPYAISFSYGQRHSFELEVAKANARRFDLRLMGGSALTADIAVPKDSVDGDIPVTYVPARNTIFLSFALGWAEVLGAFDIFIGVNALDYSGYPDCRPEYIAAFESMANLATKAGVEGSGGFRIRTPLISMTKAQIIAAGVALGVDYGLTHSCYDPSPAGLSCGRCDSCRLRLRGFAEAGLQDPLGYAAP